MNYDFIQFYANLTFCKTETRDISLNTRLHIFYVIFPYTISLNHSWNVDICIFNLVHHQNPRRHLQPTDSFMTKLNFPINALPIIVIRYFNDSLLHFVSVHGLMIKVNVVALFINSRNSFIRLSNTARCFFGQPKSEKLTINIIRIVHVLQSA